MKDPIEGKDLNSSMRINIGEKSMVSSKFANTKEFILKRSDNLIV
jgi:hypothetical protein